jgi:tRNA(His) guanylyltransferase
MSCNDSLGDRMKDNYENRQRYYLTRRTPVIVRVDGKAFHTFTKGLQKPFDKDFINAMVYSACEVARQMQGFKLAYIQSDEASFLLTDFDQLETDAWFDYNKSKIETITASCMTANFYSVVDQLALFDARAFNIPKEEVANYFLWRAKDWERNSLSMYCQSFFSQNELQGKSRLEQHDLLHSIGKNWTNDLPSIIKNGTFIVNLDKNGCLVSTLVKPEYSDIENVVKVSLKENNENN